MTVSSNLVPGIVELERHRTALAAEALAHNKQVLFDQLVRLGIHTVTVRFDGYGDSGQIEEIEAVDAASKPVSMLPPTSLPIKTALADGSGFDERYCTLNDAIETMVYDWLEETHAGWEDGEGAYGSFVFTVPDRCVTLEHNVRFVDAETFTHEF